MSPFFQPQVQPDVARLTFKEAEPNVLQLLFQKQPGMRLGASVATLQSKRGAEWGQLVIIVNIGEDGLIHDWNRCNPFHALAVGDIVSEVNGHRDPFAVMDELATCGTLSMVVHRGLRSPDMRIEVPPPPAQEMTEGRRSAPRRTMLKNKRFGHRPQKASTEVRLLPVVCASEIGCDHCAICLEDVEPHEGVAHLSCNHGFHQRCMSEWMQQGDRSICPLCIRFVW